MRLRVAVYRCGWFPWRPTDFLSPFAQGRRGVRTFFDRVLHKPPPVVLVVGLKTVTAHLIHLQGNTTGMVEQRLIVFFTVNASVVYHQSSTTNNAAFHS